MGKPEPKPDPFPEPFPEPEKPWPIDPRPAIRELKAAWDDLRANPPWRRRPPQWPPVVVVCFLAILFTWVLISNAVDWFDTLVHPRPARRFVTLAEAEAIQVGMSQEEVRGILGAPFHQEPDLWAYHFSGDEAVRIQFKSMFKVTEVSLCDKRSGAVVRELSAGR